MPAPERAAYGAVDKVAGELQQIIRHRTGASTAAPLTPNPLPKVTTSNSVLPFAASSCRAPAPR